MGWAGQRRASEKLLPVLFLLLEVITEGRRKITEEVTRLVCPWVLVPEIGIIR